MSSNRFASPPRVTRHHNMPFQSPPVQHQQQSQHQHQHQHEIVSSPSRMHHSFAARLMSPSRRPSTPSNLSATRPAAALRSPSRTVANGTGGPMRDFFSVASPNTAPTLVRRQSHDRAIPSRSSSNLTAGFILSSPAAEKKAAAAAADGSGAVGSDDISSEMSTSNQIAAARYKTLLQNELLGSCDKSLPNPDTFEAFQSNAENEFPAAHTDARANTAANTQSSDLPAAADTGYDSLLSPRRVFRFSASAPDGLLDETTDMSQYSCTPIKKSSQAVLNTSQKTARKIPKSPFKVLDAPRLTDDFYLNLVDWSAKNVLCVGLADCVYLWSASTCSVTKLVDLNVGSNSTSSRRDDAVCALSWSRKGNHLAVGTRTGDVQIHDVAQNKCLTTLAGHEHRVGVIAWNGNLIASGSRDRTILIRDLRSPNPSSSENSMKFRHHKQEVCGLEWSPNAFYLASGGNDNKLLIWDVRRSLSPVCVGKHRAAVKAITWSPHQHGLIASGGGTADRTIRFWNTLAAVNSSFVTEGTAHAMQPVEKIDTGSQVCNLLWSRNVDEIVSTHGYSLNQIVVWKYPTLEKLATLTGHTYRVLYLAGSPDGQTVVTGAGDETLRFWNIFPAAKSSTRSSIGELATATLASAAMIR